MDFRIDGQRITTCVFSFEVENLPDAEFYSVGIGGRDPVVYRRTELEERDWYLELFLGLPSQPSTRLADYQPPNMPQGPVPDYTSTTETQSQADTTVTTVADESSVTTVEKEVHRDPDEFPPPPEQPVAVSEGAGVAVGANIDCSGSDFLVAVAVRNLTDTTQTVNQAGFFPGGDAGHALLYFDFGSAVGGPTSIEPGETFHHSEAFTGLEWLESSSPVDVYVDFESDPGSLYADLQVTCP